MTDSSETSGQSVYGYIHSTESFGSVDGPGVRFIIFVSGCPLRCKYCHNPDTWKMEDGERFTSDEMLAKALRYRPYWKNIGGITVSGGEPLSQIDFVLDLFKKAKQNSVNTCIDTSGGPFTAEGPWFEKFQELMKYTDLLLVDIKHIDEESHVELTGHTGKNIKEMFRYLSDTNKPIWIRHVLVPGVTDDDGALERTRDFIRTLNNVKRVEVLPYHTLGIMKYQKMGIPYRLEGVDSPTADRLANARAILECDKYTAWETEFLN